MLPLDLHADYPRWFRRYQQPHAWERYRIRCWQARLPRQMRFSLLLADAESATPAQLAQTLRSMALQLYPRWELLLQGRPPPGWQTELPVRWIAGGWNALLHQAQGDYLALLYPGDQLACHALSVLAGATNAQSDAVLFYADEDIWDAAGLRQPQFKPAWNLLLFYTTNYLGAAVWYQRRAVLAIGGFQQVDTHTRHFSLRLRLLRQAPVPPVRVPYPLWHCAAPRAVDTASSAEVLRLHLAPVTVTPIPGGQRLHYALPVPLPQVTAIILTRDRQGLLARCVASLRDTVYPALHLCIVDNGSVEPNTLRYLAEIAQLPATQVIRSDTPFNFATLNNSAVQATQGDLLALINNDVEALEPGWLLEMVQYALQADVGLVGAKLLYPDRTVQHAGVFIGVGGVASHAGAGLSTDAPGYLGRAQAAQELSAVTAACWVLRRQVYEDLGGLDPNLAVSYNDVDFCLRVRQRGFRVVWTPHAVLLHHESASRGSDTRPEHQERALREYSYLQARWGATLLEDPFHTPNLACDRANALARPPRTPKDWQR